MPGALAALVISMAAAAVSSASNDLVTRLGLRPEVTAEPATHRRSMAPEASAIGLRPALLPATASARSRSMRPIPVSNAPGVLALWVNGTTLDVVARTVQEKGVVMIDRKAAEAAGLTIAAGAGAGYVPISALAGRTRVDWSNQALVVETDPADNPAQVFDLRPARHLGGASATGFLGSYDLALSVDGGSPRPVGVGGLVQGAIFSPAGLFTASGVARAGALGSSFVRLETTAEFDNPEAMTTVVVGDATSSALGWSRSVKFAGLQYATDFALQPNFSPLPPLDLKGAAVTPSTVDLYVNAAHVFTTTVQPGPFELRNVPLVTGAGQVEMTLTDLLGQRTSVSTPMYVSPDLLAPGLTDFGFEVGALRRDYGLASFDYGPPIAMATVRRGVTSGLTVEGHAEASPDVFVSGGGGAFRLGTFGAATLDAAVSDGRRGLGGLVFAQAQASLGPVNLFAGLTLASQRFGDIATAEGAPTPTQRYQLGGSVNLGRFGALNATWIAQRGMDVDARVWSASYSVALPRGLRAGATALYDADHAAWASEVYLRVPLGGRTSATLSADMAPGYAYATAMAQRSVSPDGGLGYQLAVSADPDRPVTAQATWVGPRAAASALATLDHGAPAVQISVAGAVVALGGQVFATRNSDGAFVLVKTGQPGIDIFREHRLVGVANAKGEALLSDLTPNADNRVEVDPTAFPVDAPVEAPEQVVNPRRRSAVVADFTPRRIKPVLLALRRKDGTPPPAGAQVTLSNGAVMVLGRRGALFFDDEAAATGGVVRWDGHACRFAAPAATGPAVEALAHPKAVDCVDIADAA